jgi:hypothetical protein
LSKLSGFTPERDDVGRINPNTGTKPDQTRAGGFRPCSVATHAPANDDEKIPVFVPQASGEEIAISVLSTTAPLGHALGDPPAHTPAQAFIIIVLATTAPLGYAFADPFAQAPAQPFVILILFLPVSPMADALAEATAHILPVLHKVDDEIP